MYDIVYYYTCSFSKLGALCVFLSLEAAVFVCLSGTLGCVGKVG